MSGALPVGLMLRDDTSVSFRSETEISYLGWVAAEMWGLVWCVLFHCGFFLVGFLFDWLVCWFVLFGKVFSFDTFGGRCHNSNDCLGN